MKKIWQALSNHDPVTVEFLAGYLLFHWLTCIGVDHPVSKVIAVLPMRMDHWVTQGIIGWMCVINGLQASLSLLKSYISLLYGYSMILLYNNSLILLYKIEQTKLSLLY